jgi:hypothetical protein
MLNQHKIVLGTLFLEKVYENISNGEISPQ